MNVLQQYKMLDARRRLQRYCTWHTYILVHASLPLTNKRRDLARRQASHRVNSSKEYCACLIRMKQCDNAHPARWMLSWDGCQCTDVAAKRTVTGGRSDSGTLWTTQEKLFLIWLPTSALFAAMTALMMSVKMAIVRKTWREEYAISKCTNPICGVYLCTRWSLWRWRCEAALSEAAAVTNEARQ